MQKKPVPIKMDNETHRLIKIIASVEGISIGDVIKKLASEYVRKAGISFPNKTGV